MLRLYNRLRYCGKKIGEYKIIEVMGIGRYGVCFKAVSENMDIVILKKLRKYNINNQKEIFEPNILAKLQNENIPKIFEIVKEKRNYGYILEYKEGKTVRELLFELKYKFSDSEIFDIGIKLIEILKYLHKNNIVHRDISISNVIVDGQQVYLIDFGLAREADGEKYRKEIDFSYLGDFLLYLIYSKYEFKENKKKEPWYMELSISENKKKVLKKLFEIEGKYERIENLEEEFKMNFKL